MSFEIINFSFHSFKILKIRKESGDNLYIKKRNFIRNTLNFTVPDEIRILPNQYNEVKNTGIIELKRNKFFLLRLLITRIHIYFTY